MEAVRQYVVSVVSAALICGIVTGLMKKGTAQEVVKLICGLFLTFTVIRPITQLDLSEFSDFGLSYSQDAARASAMGENLARESLTDIIKAETEAYILDKAAALGISVDVHVIVSDADPPVPVAIRLSGTASPYIRQQLESLIQKDLGIAKENLLWTG